ncbi:MAG: sulfur carrier protein ThiS [Clostridia bacterium]|nr:sulfur carrier protein ThiS [Clostridia bacterium]
MKIQLNGEWRKLSQGISVHQLLEDFGQDPRAVVVELNRKILGREKLKNVYLRDKDVVEIVKLVGGG